MAKDGQVKKGVGGSWRRKNEIEVIEIAVGSAPIQKWQLWSYFYSGALQELVSVGYYLIRLYD